MWKLVRVLYRLAWPWGLLALGIAAIAVPQRFGLDRLLGWVLTVGLSLFLFAVLLALLYAAARFAVQIGGAGTWACARSWHSWRRIPTKVPEIGFGYTRHTYLALGGGPIMHCQYCGAYEPPEGAAVHAAWLTESNRAAAEPPKLR